MIPSYLIPETWAELGQWLGIAFAGLAVLIGITGYLTDLFRVRHRRQVVREAREMVALIKKQNGKQDGSLPG